MSFTPSANWLDKARRSGVKPVIKAEIALPNRALLKVTDANAAATSGLTIRVGVAIPVATSFFTTTVDLVEGTDFTINGAGTLAEAAAVIQQAIEGIEISFADAGGTGREASTIYAYIKARRLAPGGWDVTGEGTATSGGLKGHYVKLIWSEKTLIAEQNGAVRASDNFVSIVAGSGVNVVSGYVAQDLKLCSGDVPWNHAHDQLPLIGDVGEVGQEIDPVERGWSGSDLTLSLIEDYAFSGDYWPFTGDNRSTGRPYQSTVRRIATDHSLLNRQCKVYLSFEDLTDQNDDVLIGLFYTKEAIPQDGGIELTLADAFETTATATYFGSFVAFHPIEIARQILNHAWSTGSSAPVDIASFDPDLDTTKSHWTITLADSENFGAGTNPKYFTGIGGMIKEPESVKDIVAAIVKIMAGTARPKGGNRGDANVGDITFIANKQTDSVDDTWDCLDDCDEIVVDETFQNIANVVSINHAKDVNGESDDRLSETLTFINSQSIDQLGRRFELNLDTDLLNSFSRGMKKPRDDLPEDRNPVGGLRGPFGQAGAATVQAPSWGRRFDKQLPNNLFFWQRFLPNDTHFTVDAIAHGFCGGRFVRTYTTQWNIGIETAASGLTTGGAVERRAFIKIINDGEKSARSRANIVQHSAFADDEKTPEVVAAKNSYFYKRDKDPRFYSNSVVSDNYAELNDGEGLDAADPNTEYDTIEQFIGKPGTDSGNSAYVPAGQRQLGQSLTYEVDTSYNDEGFINGRGGLGTRIPEFWNDIRLGIIASVVDITIPKQLAQEHLKRWSFGAIVLRVRTRLDKIGLEVGDLVNLTRDDRVMGLFEPFIDSTYVWEITRKEVRPLDDSPGIDWQLTFMRKDSFVFETFRQIPIATIRPSTGLLTATNSVVDVNNVDVYIDGDLDTVADTLVVA